MLHFSFQHFLCQLVVTAWQIGRCKQIISNVIVDTPFACEMACEHMTLDVFAKEVAITKESSIYHPHAHRGLLSIIFGRKTIPAKCWWDFGVFLLVYGGVTKIKNQKLK